MKKRKGIVVLALILIMAVVAAGCVSKTAATVEVGGETIATLYSVVGEKNITGSSKSAGTDGSVVEITYGGGVVSTDELNQYIGKMVNESGYMVTKQVESDGTTQSYQIGKAAQQAGNIILIDFKFAEGGDTVITYTVAQGTVTPS